jgi:hypothetical protein
MMPNTDKPSGLRPVPTPPPWQPALDAMAQRAREQAATISHLRDRLDELETMILSTAEELGQLKRRVAAAGQVPSTEDDRVLAFLRSVPGVSFSATSIAQNLGLTEREAGSRIAKCAQRLVRDGKIKATDTQGRRSTYYVPREGS